MTLHLVKNNTIFGCFTPVCRPIWHDVLKLGLVTINFISIVNFWKIND